MSTRKSEKRGYAFGTFQGVFTPSILTIIGVVMYLRFGWMLGNVGLAASLLIVTIGSAITFLTGLSISALATNMRMKGGGAYFILSRSLGLEAGAALGIPLALSQSICVSFYVAGFAEALVNSSLPVVSGWDVRIVGLATLAILGAVATLSADIALKSQFFIMGAIAFSLVSFFAGASPDVAAPAKVVPHEDFWVVFAVFFPAVTGILSGLGMSGDLKNPGKSIPLGTLSAVLTGYAVYMAIPIALNAFVSDPALLRSNTMILQKCARWQFPILLGVWAATLSSAIGSFLCAPRVLQALSRDRLLPGFLGRGFGKADEPYFASVCCFAIAALGILLGDINILAPILTLFNLSTYGLLNFCAAMEEAMSNPAWRPTFRVKAYFSFAGFVFCVAVMFMISPGWTFAALFCEAAIYWFVKRKNLRARWSDMRGGIYASLAKFALARMEVSKAAVAARNWRPNLLVLSRLPIQNPMMFNLAKGVSGPGSFVTFASVLPEAFADVHREGELRDSVLRAAEKAGVDGNVKLLPAADEFAGVSELVRTYGFGAVSPNTIVLGIPQNDAHCLAMAGVIRTAVQNSKNVILTGDGSDVVVPSGPVDVWWRGGGGNGSLMLALAFLLFRKAELRVNMIVGRRSREEAENELSSFLRNVRFPATTRVVEMGEAHFSEIIKMHSLDASLTFIGLRQPSADETNEAYGRYLLAMFAMAKEIPLPVFVLAAEDVDFRRIFE